MQRTKVDVTVTGLIDGRMVQLSVNEVEGMTEEMAEAINAVRADSDHIEALQADYDRHNRDKVVEGIRRAIQGGLSEDNTDPLDKYADPRTTDIFSIIYPENEKESEMVVAVREIIAELPEQQRQLFFKHYALKLTFDEIVEEEFLTTGKRVTRQAMSQRNQRMLARVKKRLGEKVQIPF